MRLSQKQADFTLLVSKLIAYAYEQGYALTLGDGYRDPRVHGVPGEKKSYSHPNSTHKFRLAIDFNLFKDGQFLGTTEAHRPLGEWWEGQHPLARWGGRFSDGNHYSFEHEGVS